MNLGSVMLSTLKSIAEYLQVKTQLIAMLAEKYSTVITAIMGTIAALISLKILTVSVGYGFTFLASTVLGLRATIIATFSFLSTTVFPAVIIGLRAIGLAVMSNPIGAIITAIAIGATLVMTNWQKMKEIFAGIWEYIKSILKPIGEALSWMGSTASSIFGAVSESSPVKKFEDNLSVVNELSKNSVFSNGDPLANNSAVRQLSENSKKNLENLKVKSVIEEKKTTHQEEVEKALKELLKSRCENRELKVYNQALYQTFNINIKAEPSQDIRSIANAVIERFREQARGALFDIVEKQH